MNTFLSFFKRFGLWLSAVVIIGAAFGLGLYFGTQSSKTMATESLPSAVDMDPFWKAWGILEERYVNSTTTKKLTDQEKIYGAIEGLARSYGDPYTVFFPPQESKDFQAEIKGQLEGVGMEVGIRDGVITVIAPLKNTPAYRAGVKAGDKILKIDSTVTNDMTVEEAIRLIRGKKGTTVTLTLFGTKDSKPHEIKIVRDVINIPTLDTEKRSDGIFVIKLYNFSENSAGLFRNALQQFVDTKSNKLVLDLRGNPGGYLEAAVNMASWFLPAEKVIVKQDTAGKGEDYSHKSYGYDVFNDNLKMVILVDAGSASASEILAGALQEHGVAKLVGTKTYGKGSVQELIPVTPDTSLKVTVARWLTPNGHSISDQGLKPDVEVENKAEEVEKGIDAQMNKAVELIRGM